MPDLINVKTKTPDLLPGRLSKLLIVSVAEFGMKPILVFARAWQSMKNGIPNGEIKYYMDIDSYGLENPYEIGEVTGWMYAPEPIKPLSLNEQLKLISEVFHE